MNKTGYSDPLLKLSQTCLYVAAVHETMSFTRAAEQLGVHQSAVSHRIKQLEERLGFSLYDRTTRKLIPTEAGSLLGKAASGAIAEFQRVLQQIEARREQSGIRLSASSSLALKWLVPLLPGAAAAGLDISLHVQERPADLASGDVDAAIRFSAGPFPGLHAVRLCASSLVAIASPSFIRAQEINEISPWKSAAPLLGDRTGETDGTHFSWTEIAAARGHTDTVTPTVYFDRADLMLQAALSGLGIALGRTLLIENDIKNGFLVTIGPAHPMIPAYWLVCTPDTAKTLRFQQLLKWLQEQIEATSTVE